MIALSTPSPASAERTCSTVCTFTAPSPSVVARSTIFTFSMLASIVGASARSARRNLRPKPAGAGCSVSVTSSPVWSEEPERLALWASVDCEVEVMRAAPYGGSGEGGQVFGWGPLVGVVGILHRRTTTVGSGMKMDERRGVQYPSERSGYLSDHG